MLSGSKHGVGELRNSELLVVGLLGGDDRGVGAQQEVDARVGHQVGLELVESTLRAPSKRSEAVMEETTWAMRRFRLV